MTLKNIGKPQIDVKVIVLVAPAASPGFIRAARTYMALSRRVASYADPTICIVKYYSLKIYNR